MKPVLLLVASSLLALSGCGIPATGVVEAGAPASGITPVTPVYLLLADRLVAVPRTTEFPGDVQAAVDLLLLGPTSEEVARGLSTEVRARPTVAPDPAGAPRQPSPAAPTVSVRDDALTIELPSGTGPLSDVATRQVICTAAAAHRLTDRATASVTAVVGESGRWRATGTDESCP
ncbi:hypothetical protein ABZ896_51065 [Streptomyces sp. NPDC047072]|uniref:hypothetical protein n=1 Tax=Streptomyces sp. NPDC047072 TaxID=3154809 RepID=UPI0033E9292B